MQRLNDRQFVAIGNMKLRNENDKSHIYNIFSRIEEYHFISSMILKSLKHLIGFSLEHCIFHVFV
jgi:hypothetical protein